MYVIQMNQKGNIMILWKKQISTVKMSGLPHLIVPLNIFHGLLDYFEHYSKLGIKRKPFYLGKSYLYLY